MLVSVAIAAALSYPTVFLSENPTAGFTSVPHHVWTAARPVSQDQSVQIDVEMRQIWVHGTYMKALEKSVLKSALKIQQTLVGGENQSTIFPALARMPKSNSIDWGFHSPLMYWNNSADAIDADADVVKTINDQARSSSSLDVSLRPASVLAGKTFHSRKLVAADALVLTLMNRMEDGVGSKWQDKMHSLEDSACPSCTLYPPHGEISRSRLYELSFTPLTVRENIALAVAYGCTALYVLLSLRRLKAFHSRFGLVVTAITQMSTSILASFTICGMLKVNLATVPQNAYPFIVLVIGLENMFRLINAILAYPPTMATDLRIANGLGDIGPLSIATAAQNLLILWILAIVVSPGIAAFCAFAAIATLVDTFFLLTFFVAVLNVDVRRLELQDSLSRSKGAALRQKSPQPQAHRTWLAALIHGKVPLSTRMAGSIVTTTFILTLNYHFFERKEKRMTLRHLLGLFGGTADGLSDFDTFAPPPMNATLTPGEWMRMQDFDTAREVMRLVDPGAETFIIRVFAPLVVVLSGADRTGVPQGAQAWGDALRTFALHNMFPFAVVVVFVVTFVAVLMNFLLWNGAPEISDVLLDRSEEALTVEHVQTPHKLDIVRLHGCNSGHFVSIALSRTIAVSLFDRNQGIHFSETLPPEILSGLTWPVRNAAIDDSGQWLAFHTGDDQVAICNWKIKALQWSFPYPDDHPSLVFEFGPLPSRERSKTCLTVLTSAGRLATQAIDESTVSSKMLSNVSLIGASLVVTSSNERRLFVVTEKQVVASYDFRVDGWAERAIGCIPLDAISGRVNITSLTDEEENGLLLLQAAGTLLLVDGRSLQVLKSCTVDRTGLAILGPSLRCAGCGRLALRFLGIAEDDQRLGELHLTTLSSSTDEANGLCTHETSAQCGSLDDAASETHTLQQPGSWMPLPSHAVLGLRKSVPNPSTNGLGDQSQVRLRRTTRRSLQPVSTEEDRWEAYAMSLDGSVATVDLADCMVTADGDPDATALFVTKAGPAVLLGDHSVAIAFGNAVKVLKAAKTGPSLGRPDVQGLERHSSTTRKRGVSRKAL